MRMTKKANRCRCDGYTTQRSTQISNRQLRMVWLELRRASESARLTAASLSLSVRGAINYYDDGGMKSTELRYKRERG